MIVNEEIKQLVESGYSQSRCNEYKAIYKQLFNKTPSGCSCDCGAIYNAIKNNMKTKNPNQTKNTSTGKFEKVLQHSVEQIIETDPDRKFIKEVKDEIMQGYFYQERILKAYQLIVGTEDSLANAIAMRRTIIAYEV